ncbi:helix-turn-helix transcriptional regulator [Bathymodiolus platifrons methanotrophic gill symbiont]|uniref:helix-turn-helix transcriptional regulator n=1 Tax=Bathymodiolus platifrons methanotrophic gill symbiont TaxID=113268 RepID=UPI000B41E561|nr:helix-turn-helix domain-containing protein [Bathymodiolus platifrons methanotrophic gill symbiont]
MTQSKLSTNRINQKQLANYWGISERTLERWRGIGYGPVFIKIGGRVIYRQEDIREYENTHLNTSTQSQVYI